jgi:acetyl esterase/lipase
MKSEGPAMRISTDIHYGHGLLDLYLPPAGSEADPYPLVIWSQGSAFASDSGRDGADFVAERLGPYGFAVAGVSVPGTVTSIFPAQLDAVRAAVAFLRRDARFDPGRIAAMGESSGGWAAAMAGLATDAISAVVAFYPPTDLAAMTRHAREAGLTPVPGWHPVDAMGTMAGGRALDHDQPDSPESRLIGGPVPEHLDLAAEASPIFYVRKDAPPFLLLHGELDPYVPWPQSRALAEALAAAGAEAELIRFPHAGHSVWRTWLDDPDLKAGARRWSPGASAEPVDPTWDTIAQFLTRRRGS